MGLEGNPIVSQPPKGGGVIFLAEWLNNYLSCDFFNGKKKFLNGKSLSGEFLNFKKWYKYYQTFSRFTLSKF